MSVRAPGGPGAPDLEGLRSRLKTLKVTHFVLRTAESDRALQASVIADREIPPAAIGLVVQELLGTGVGRIAVEIRR